MQKILFSLLFPLLLFSYDLEVALPTRPQKTELYISKLHVPESAFDWRYFEELRDVLAFDLRNNGCSTVISNRAELDETFAWPEVREQFNVGLWKKERIPYVLAVQVFKNRLQLIAFNIEKGVSKKYADFLISGKIEEDRRLIHQLADTVQKDLFGVDGIASLQILYSKRCKVGDDWASEIWIADSDGMNARRVLKEKGYCMSPGFFSPQIAKGDEFYYTSFGEGQSKIYRASLQAPVGEAMISLRGSQVLPAMNKQGSQMAFIADAAGRPDLFIQNLGSNGQVVGKPRQLYSASQATQASPTFSPDGKQIAFVSDKDGPPRIYLINVVGPKETKKQQPRLLTKKNRENTSPSWSPDGTKLAYSAKVDGVRQIWVYEFATEEEIAVTTGPDNKENPSWAPDSLHLVYNTENEDESELYRTHWAQREPILISQGPGQKRFPCFSIQRSGKL